MDTSEKRKESVLSLSIRHTISFHAIRKHCNVWFFQAVPQRSTLPVRNYWRCQWRWIISRLSTKLRLIRISRFPKNPQTRSRPLLGDLFLIWAYCSIRSIFFFSPYYFSERKVTTTMSLLSTKKTRYFRIFSISGSSLNTTTSKGGIELLITPKASAPNQERLGFRKKWYLVGETKLHHSISIDRGDFETCFISI